MRFYLSTMFLAVFSKRFFSETVSVDSLMVCKAQCAHSDAEFVYAAPWFQVLVASFPDDCRTRPGCGEEN